MTQDVQVYFERIISLDISEPKRIVNTIQKIEKELREKNVGYTLTSILISYPQLDGLIYFALPKRPIFAIPNLVIISYSQDLEQKDQMKLIYVDTLSNETSTNTV